MAINVLRMEREKIVEEILDRKIFNKIGRGRPRLGWGKRVEEDLKKSKLGD